MHARFRRQVACVEKRLKCAVRNSQTSVFSRASFLFFREKITCTAAPALPALLLLLRPPTCVGGGGVCVYAYVCVCVFVLVRECVDECLGVRLKGYEDETKSSSDNTTATKHLFHRRPPSAHTFIFIVLFECAN